MLQRAAESGSVLPISCTVTADAVRHEGTASPKSWASSKQVLEFCAQLGKDGQSMEVPKSCTRSGSGTSNASAEYSRLEATLISACLYCKMKGGELGILMYFAEFCDVVFYGMQQSIAVLIHLDEGTMSVACAIGSTCASAADSCWFPRNTLAGRRCKLTSNCSFTVACFSFLPFHPPSVSINYPVSISIAILGAYPIFRHAHIFSHLLWPLSLQPLILYLSGLIKSALMLSLQ